ncbi:RNA methyltransferase [bacterium]|nr:RNA methyltransferase [bacterium]
MLEAENTRVVLCSPEGEANMGGTARSMLCFGVQELYLVSPRHPLNDMAYNWACHGREILDSSHKVSTLQEAVQDVNLILGFTRRSGKRRHKFVSLPDLYTELYNHPQPGKVALVFGNEESGLSNEELECCHRLVTIPSENSLNLSHAVSLALYELFGRHKAIDGVKPKKFASSLRRKQLMEAITKYLSAMGYPPQRGASEVKEMTRFADILDRANLEDWEINFLGGMFKHLYVKYQSMCNHKEDE